MALQKLTSYLGVKKQTAKGAGAATPATFGLGLLDGTLLNMDISQDAEELTLNGGVNDRFAPAVIRSGIQPGLTAKFPLTSPSFPLFMYGALGTINTTGAGPYVHTITPAQTLPYYTLFTKLDTDLGKLVDAVVDELTVSWDERNAAEVEASFLAITPTVGGGAFTATGDETILAPYQGIGGTLNLSVASATPATARVKAATIKISNSLEPINLSASVLPDDVFPTRQTIEGTITLVPADMTDWNKAVTGNATGVGTAVTASPVYGSFALTLAQGADSMKFEALRSAFLIDYPSSDPGGGPVELELAFTVVRSTGATAAFTFVGTNTTVSY